MTSALDSNSKIELKLTSEELNILKRAAKINKLSLSSYIINTSLRQAKMDIENQDILTLSNKDRDLVVSLLNNPPEPNEALKNLFV